MSERTFKAATERSSATKTTPRLSRPRACGASDGHYHERRHGGGGGGSSGAGSGGGGGQV